MGATRHSPRRPARAVHLGTAPAAAVNASAAVGVGDCRVLHGWSIRETTGAAGAALRLRDGKGTDGEVLVSISLTAGESTRDWLSGLGIEITTGLVFLEVVSGSVEGALWVAPDSVGDW